jgi:hypothetical protein
MAATYWSGIAASVSFAPTGGGTINVDNKTWNKSKKNKLIEVTNANSGNNEKYMAGVYAQSGDFDFFWDSTNQPETGGMVEGATGVLTENLAASAHGYTQAIILEELSIKTATAEAIIYNAKYRGNGPITRF